MHAKPKGVIDFSPDRLHSSARNGNFGSEDLQTAFSNEQPLLTDPKIHKEGGLDIRRLNAWYGKFQAIRGVTLGIKPRAITALIGPSGSGKSTFLRCLNRMHEVIPGARSEGEVLFDGRNILDPRVDPVLVRRRIGMVFQRPNPFPTKSIFENVAAGLRIQGTPRSIIAERVEKSLRQ